jgi:eukaryotic-like serine/threonine-protein kinase
VRRFHEEAQIGGQLQHPNLVPVYEMGVDADGSPFFAMKLVKGKTLDTLLKARTTLADDLTTFLSIFEKVAEAVGFAHSKNVLHRDLKPSNIMVGAFGEVQVMDWGLAKVLGRPSEPHPRPGPVPVDLTSTHSVQTVRSESGDSESRAGSVMGTPAYMPPEQARGEVDKLDTRTDVFGLGAILCEILTGEPPYTGPNANEILVQAAMGDLEPAYDCLDRCGADVDLVDLARACLAVSPDDRPRDGGAVAEAVANYRAGVLARYQAAELERAAAEARAQEAQQRARAERRARFMTVGLAASMLLTLILGGGAFLWVRQERQARDAEQARQRLVQEEKAGRLIQAVQSDLDRAEQARRSNKPGDARAALERAEGRLTEGGGDDEVRARAATLRVTLDQERKDQEMRDRLDQAHIDSIDSGDDLENSGPTLYSEAFLNYGLDVEKLSPEDAAQRIRSSPVRKEMITALDGWVRFYPFETGKISRKGTLANHLLQVAELADEDGWPRRLRSALRGNRRDEVLKLADSAEARTATASGALLLADALIVMNNPGRALEILQAARRLHPDNFWITVELGKTNQFKNPTHFEEAVRYFTAAVSLRPDHPAPHLLLARGLRSQRRFEEAILSYQEALRLMPKYAVAHNGLGELYLTQGKLDLAARCFREAIESRKPRRFPLAHLNLGKTLSRQGRFKDSLAEFQLVARVNEESTTWHTDAEKLGEEAKRYIALNDQLPLYLSRELKAADANQKLDLARVCSRKRLFANAVRFYQEAFTAQSSLLNQVKPEIRDEAAQAAVQAAVGNGVDTPPPTDMERAGLHKNAIAWLRIDLTNLSKRLNTDRPDTQQVLREARRLQQEDLLIPVRDKASLARVAEPERAAWQKFWHDVDDLISRASDLR